MPALQINEVDCVFRKIDVFSYFNSMLDRYISESKNKGAKSAFEEMKNEIKENKAALTNIYKIMKK